MSIRYTCNWQTNAEYISSIKATTWGELAPMHWLTVAFGSLSAILDLILAASMIYLLDRSRTGFKKTNALLSRLILLTLSTGLLSAIVSMAQVILVSQLFKECSLYAPVVLKAIVRLLFPRTPSYILGFILSERNVCYSHYFD